MAASLPSPVDVEMAEAGPSTASSLSPPPEPDSDYEDVDEKEDSPNHQLTSLEKISISSPLNGIELTKMARRSERKTNKPKTVLVATPKKPVKRKIVTKVSSARKAPKWTTEKLLTDPKSPLANADLRSILCQPAAWDILTKEERAEIIALFPAGTRILDEGTDDARPDFDALRNDNNFRHDCATYTDNIALGKHDPEWLEEAWAARDRRRAGDFDDYLVQKFEEEWSCELPEEFKPKRDSGVSAAEVNEDAESSNEVKNHSEEPATELNGTIEGEDALGTLDKEPKVDEETHAANEPVIQLGSPVPEDNEEFTLEIEVKTDVENPAAAKSQKTKNNSP
ncbi:proline-rich early nodulin [Colletotrichum truncatum]|uniref:Proline-rich early nodulin n=1 Tax=Colletotrichum truncatum TaxID=5467 RepID=A0ACC3ZIT6_COLTU